LAQIKNKFEILAGIEEPVNEISSIISAYITIHQGNKIGNLEELKQAIEQALLELEE